MTWGASQPFPALRILSILSLALCASFAELPDTDDSCDSDSCVDDVSLLQASKTSMIQLLEKVPNVKAADAIREDAEEAATIKDIDDTIAQALAEDATPENRVVEDTSNEVVEDTSDNAVKENGNVDAYPKDLGAGTLTNPEDWEVAPKDAGAGTFKVRYGWVKPPIVPAVNNTVFFKDIYPFTLPRDEHDDLEHLSFTNPQAAAYPGHPGKWSAEQKEEDIKLDKEMAPVVHKENSEADHFYKNFPFMLHDELDELTSKRKLYSNEHMPLSMKKLLLEAADVSENAATGNATLKALALSRLLQGKAAKHEEADGQEGSVEGKRPNA